MDSSAKQDRLFAMHITIVPAILGLMLGSLSADTPAEPPFRWWKGNLHTHTFWSDGNDFPEMVAAWYSDHGYNFLSLTDHNILSRGEKWLSLEKVETRSNGSAWEKYQQRFAASWIETRQHHDDLTEVRLKPISEFRSLFERAGEFLLIEAEEITDKADNGRSIHMNATHLVDLIPPPGGTDVVEVIRQSLAAVQAQRERYARPILFHVNHLNYKWSVTAEDLAAVAENRFFEIWNGVDNDHDPGDETHPSTDEIWDIANTLRMLAHDAPPLFGLATDDSHEYHGHRERARPGRAWIQVHAQYLTPESIIHAMNAGRFYASTGVELETIDVIGREQFNIRIKAQPGAHYETHFIGTRRGKLAEGKPRRDAAGEEVRTTLRYEDADSVQIGETLAIVEGVEPSYTFDGDELYVRAVVYSDQEPAVPSTEYPVTRAWTQPVGWK